MNHRAATVADAIQRNLPPYTTRKLSLEARIPETSTARILNQIKNISHAKIDISYRAIGLGIIVIKTSSDGYKGISNNAMLSHWLKSVIMTVDRDYLATFVFPVDDDGESAKAIIETVKSIDKDARIIGSFEEKVYAKPSLVYYRSRSALSPLQALHVQGGHPPLRIVSYDYNVTRFNNIKDLYRKNRRETYMFAMALGERNALEMTRSLMEYFSFTRGLSRGTKSRTMNYIKKMSWAIRGSKLALLGRDAVSVAFVVKAPSHRCLKEAVTNAMTYLYASSLTINESEGRMMSIIILPKLDNVILDGMEEMVQAGCATIEETLILRKPVLKVTIPFTNFNIDKWLSLKTPIEKLEELLKRKDRKYKLRESFYRNNWNNFNNE